MLGCSCAADKVEKLRVYWHWCRILPLVTFGTVSSYQHSIRFAPCGSQWITWATKDGTKAAPCLALTVGLTVSAICFPHTQEAPQLRPDLQRSATSTVGQSSRKKGICSRQTEGGGVLLLRPLGRQKTTKTVCTNHTPNFLLHIEVQATINLSNKVLPPV